MIRSLYFYEKFNKTRLNYLFSFSLTQQKGFL